MNQDEFADKAFKGLVLVVVVTAIVGIIWGVAMADYSQPYSQPEAHHSNYYDAGCIKDCFATCTNMTLADIVVCQDECYHVAVWGDD